MHPYESEAGCDAPMDDLLVCLEWRPERSRGLEETTLRYDFLHIAHGERQLARQQHDHSKQSYCYFLHYCYILTELYIYYKVILLFVLYIIILTLKINLTGSYFLCRSWPLNFRAGPASKWLLLELSTLYLSPLSFTAPSLQSLVDIFSFSITSRRLLFQRRVSICIFLIEKKI